MSEPTTFDSEFSAEMNGAKADDLLGMLTLDDVVDSDSDNEDSLSFLSSSPLAEDFTSAMSEILGSATLQEIERRQITIHKPILVKRPIKEKFREWQVDTGPVFGPAGAEVTVTIRPQCRFRSEKVMATDDSSTPGKGTRILSITVGNRVQRVGNGQGALTAFFSAQALANGIKFDTASQWSSISIRVAFVQQCNFEMSIFGTAETDGDGS